MSTQARAFPGLRALMRKGFDTADLARLLRVSEADVYRELARQTASLDCSAAAPAFAEPRTSRCTSLPDDLKAGGVNPRPPFLVRGGGHAEPQALDFDAGEHAERLPITHHCVSGGNG